VARHIARLHGGACFTLSLPAQAPLEALDERAFALTSPAPTGFEKFSGLSPCRACALCY
jgi:hypothetical protein